jgi:hypothetical protein
VLLTAVVLALAAVLPARLRGEDDTGRQRHR